MLKQILASLPLILITACNSQTPQLLQRGIPQAAPTFQNAPRSLQSFSATTSKNFPYGLGAKLEGLRPMSDNEGEFGTLAALPSLVDLRPQMSPIYNQGQTQACVGYSTVGGLGEYYARKRGWNMRFSPRYLWNLGRQMEHSVENNQGMYLEDAIKVIDNLGMMPEADYPMLTTNPTQDPQLFDQVLKQLPTNAQIAQAKKFRISQGWQRVESVHAMRKMLSEGKPVVFALMVHDNMWSAKGGLIPMPTATSKPVGGHAIVAVGYDNQKRHFIIRNSWGTEWGDQGYGYLPYDYFRNDVKSASIYAGFTVK